MLARQIHAKKHAVLMACVLISFSRLAITAPSDEGVEAEEVIASIEEESAEAEVIQNLDQGINLEERLQLRRDLVEYSRAVDPRHIQIEERRRVMRKRIQERFLGSDKDNDGGISREEAAETLPQIFRHFTQVDFNDDGVISVSELEAVQARAIERQRAAEVKERAIAQDKSLKPKSKQASANPKNDL
jgi:hypothetical protein